MQFMLKLATTHQDLFEINQSMINDLYEAVQMREKPDSTTKTNSTPATIHATPHYILKPQLSHLLEPDFFPLQHNESTYYVPLWYHELTYPTKCGHITVRCCPDLPEYMYIDDDDNLHVNLSINKLTLKQKKELDIPVGNTTLKLPINQITKENTFQTYTHTHIFSGIGIPHTNLEYNKLFLQKHITRADIKIHIHVN